MYIYCIYVYIHISWYFIGFDSPFWPLFTAAKVKDQQGSEVQFKCLGCRMGWFLGGATWICNMDLSLFIRRIVMHFTTTTTTTIISIITFIHWATLRTDKIRNRGAFTKELGHLQQQNRDELIQWVRPTCSMFHHQVGHAGTSSMNFPVPVYIILSRNINKLSSSSIFQV